MKASDLFVRCLEEEGVERIFGVPGEENADTMISLLDSKIDFILCRHEQAAAFMADVYGRLTGKSGVCLATLGPGATNLVTGIADANMDRAPLVGIIGQAGTYRLHKESHQNMDSIAMFRPITKWAQTVSNASAIPEIVRKAFKVAEQEKPGAVLIELPEDLAKNDVAEAIAKPMKPVRTRRPGADHKAIKEAVDVILAAKNPMILAGNGAIRKRAAAQLAIMAEKLGIGVINTFMGKGAVPRSSEYCLFTMGLQGKDHANVAIDACDTIISVGYDLVEYSPSHWNKTKGKKIVHIDFWPAEVDTDYDATVDVQGDIADALWQVNKELDDRGVSKPPFDIAKVQPLRQRILDDFAMEKDSDAFPMKPQKVLWDVREVMGEEDILLSDVGAHKMWISRYYQCDTPNTCLISNGFCTMGFAMPGSIGAKFAKPDSRVLAINGDAGFMMNVQDIETAARLKLNVVWMVWCDSEYGLIKWKQQNQFGGKHSELKFTNPDFAKMAESFGIWGRNLKSAAELKPALEEAFQQDGPALIALPIDYAENVKMTKRLGEIDAVI